MAYDRRHLVEAQRRDLSAKVLAPVLSQFFSPGWRSGSEVDGRAQIEGARISGLDVVGVLVDPVLLVEQVVDLGPEGHGLSGDAGVEGGTEAGQGITIELDRVVGTQG